MLYEEDVEFVQETYSHRGETPSSVEEAERWLTELGSRTAWIDAQLGDPLRREGLANGEYRAWRRSAIAAKTHLMDEARQLKLWIAQDKAEQKRRRHEKYMEASKDRAQKLKMERGKWAVLAEAYDSIRLLHEVFVAASLLIDDDSDENWDGLEQAVNFARGRGRKDG